LGIQSWPFILGSMLNERCIFLIILIIYNLDKNKLKKKGKNQFYFVS